MTVCNRWRWSFDNFLEDVGPCPSPKHTIERKRNELGYEPGNVRWATRDEQARNKSVTRLLTFNGETLCMADWAARLGIRKSTLHYRLEMGWPLEKALTTHTTQSLRKTTHSDARNAQSAGDDFGLTDSYKDGTPSKSRQISTLDFDGAVAQLGERRVRNATPSLPTDQSPSS